jgi:hypothetical protein
MAAGPSHYQMAERLLTVVTEIDHDDVTPLVRNQPEVIAAAQVHATLALVAVAAEPIVQRYFGDEVDRSNAASDLAWVRAVT